ncbi:MAG: TerB family tellurite resistance protein, partial [Pseudomonadota bacterium]
MSLWQRLIESGKRLFDVDVVEDPVPADLDCAPDPNDVGFTAAVVGLGAKMAKADGRVTDDEIMVFSRVFQTAPKDATAVRRVFSLAQQTVKGYESYARKIGRKYAARPCLLEGVLDGLFMIATADGVVTEDELTYLQSVSEAFGFTEATFRRIKTVFGVIYQTDPDLADKVPEIVANIVKDVPAVEFDRCGMSAFGPSSLDYDLVFYSLQPDFNRAMAARSRVLLALFRGLQEN